MSTLKEKKYIDLDKRISLLINESGLKPYQFAKKHKQIQKIITNLSILKNYLVIIKKPTL